MPGVLDITPLRSLIAVADSGGFHRAAEHLRLSQSAVSQHIRRLERVIGRPLVEPDGRRARLTPSGLALLAEARRIIALHDEALHRLAVSESAVPAPFVLGATDHAADHLLPPVAAALGQAFPDLQVTYRFDRTTPLNEEVDRGGVDLAIFISEASTRQGRPVGSLPLVWCAAPGWRSPPAPRPLPLIAIHEPCAIRRRALTALAAHGMSAQIVGEAAYLAGVLNAARAGLGVTLLALAGPPPEGLVALPDLPPVSPISLTGRSRQGADPEAVEIALQALSTALSSP